jgi:hypothetical protein
VIAKEGCCPSRDAIDSKLFAIKLVYVTNICDIFQILRIGVAKSKSIGIRDSPEKTSKNII